MAMSNKIAVASATHAGASQAYVEVSCTGISADALLVVDFSALRSSNLDPGAPTISVDGGLTGIVGTWEIESVADYIAGSADNVDRTYLRAGYAVAQVTGTPGSAGNVRVTFGANCQCKIIQVSQITGHNQADPVVQSASAVGTGTTLEVTLPGSPAATSLVSGMVSNHELAGTASAPAPGTGFTEIDQDTVALTPGAIAYRNTQQNQFDLASADATCDWTGLVARQSIGWAVEIAEAASTEEHDGYLGYLGYLGGGYGTGGPTVAGTAGMRQGATFMLLAGF